MTGIRVTYVGLISFVVGLISVFTGLVFTLIITRELSPEEFGTWSLIGGLTGYVLILEPIVSFWVIREVARGKDSGKTAFISSSAFSGISTIVYVIIILSFVTQIDVDQNILLFAAILVPVLFLRHTLYAINLGHNPQASEYGFLAFEITKIPAALILILFLEQGIYGAILVTFIASLASVTIQLIRAFDKIKGSFSKEILKNWLKTFWLPIYPRISELLLISDIVIVALFLGSTEYIAYWSAAFAIASIIPNAGKISKAVYLKLLEGGKKEYFQENLVRVLFFAFPLCSMTVIFAKPALFVLNPLYVPAIPIVIVLTIVMFTRMFARICLRPLVGLERIDINKNATFKDYLRSKLFFVPTLHIIQQGSYLAGLTIMLFLFINTESGMVLIFYWALVALITQVPFAIYSFALVKRNLSPKINSLAVMKYLGSSIFIFSLTYIIMENTLVYSESIFEFLPRFLIYAILSFASYLILTSLIDSKTKHLFQSVIKEVLKNK